MFDDAADFQFGEMETKRLAQLAQPIPLRLVSLTAWYRRLSAYGVRPGLALFWLLTAIFLIFPLLYFATGYSRHPLDAITYSLKTSTFMEASKTSAEPAESALPIATKFVAGLERLAVTLQAGLFALALRRKFGRS